MFKNIKIPKFTLFGVSLSLIFLMGFLLRVIGIYPGYPQTHPDEPVLYATAVHLILNNTLDPFLASTYKFQYPGFIIYLYAGLFKFFFIPLNALFLFITSRDIFFKYISDEILAAALFGRGYINAMYWARYLTAIISFFSIPLVYLVAKEMFHKYIGLIAALFLAVNYRHTLSSHFSLIDGPNATFALLVLYVAIRVCRSPTLRNYCFLGIALALSIATKLYIFSILAFLFARSLVVLSEKNKKARIQELFSQKVFLSGSIAVIIFYMLNPFLPSHFETARQTHQYSNMRYGLFYPPFEITFPPLWYLFEIGYGKIMTALFFAGVILLVIDKRYRVQTAFLSLFILLPAAILIYFSHGAAYVRNFASIIPFALIISAYAFCLLFEYIWKFKKNGKLYLTILIVIALFASSDQIRNVIKLDYYGTKPWNSACIQQWIDDTIKSDDIVAVNNLVPRSNNDGISYVVFDNTESHKNTFTLAGLQAEKIGYVVADIEYLRGRFMWWVSSSEPYWGMPVDIFDNSFDGLVLKELSRYIVKTCVKPWQSPGNNYIAIKIPKESKQSELVLLQLHDFKPQFNKVWELSDRFNSPITEDVRVVDSPDCLNQYCLRVEGRSLVPSTEKILITDYFSVVPQERYVVKVKVKSDRKIDSQNRDGFVRIDYYSSQNVDHTKRGTIASVSPRYLGDGIWTELTVSQVAPQGAAYMQISFQVERYNTTFLVDDVKIYKTKEKPTQEEIDASNRKEIVDEVLYPLALL